MEGLDEIRKHRFQLEQYPFYNDNGYGISFFDAAMILIGVIFLDLVFKLHLYIPFCGRKQLAYYLLIIPLVILISHVSAHIVSLSQGKQTILPEELTYLNEKIFSADLNFYHIIVFLLLYSTYQSCKGYYYSY